MGRSLFGVALIPAVFGLIGFVEPCSLGVNLLFLDRIKGCSRVKRVSETVIFTIVRGFFLALVGLSAAFIGGRIVTLQASFFWVLGGVYIFLGALAIVNMYKPVVKYGMNISKYLPQGGSVALGLLFGLVIPACAIPLVLALVGKSIVFGNLLGGFASLFVFGLALSSPLLVISWFEKSTEIIRSMWERSRRIPWLAGAVLIAVGLFTIISSTWWGGSLPG